MTAEAVSHAFLDLGLTVRVLLPSGQEERLGKQLRLRA